MGGFINLLLSKLFAESASDLRSLKVQLTVSLGLKDKCPWRGCVAIDGYQTSY